MNLKSNKGTFEGVIFFLLSPVLSLPLIILNLFKGNAFMNKLLICLCSFIAFLYIPAFSNDKMRYLERYTFFKSINFSDYINYLIVTKRPDFILETLVYAFATFNLRIEYLFFIVTFFTMMMIYKVIEKVVNIKSVIFVTFLFFLTISFPNLFSGIRFYFGLAFMFVALYNLLEEKNKRKFIFYSCLAIFTHFSMLLLVLTALIIVYFKKINAKYLFIGSLVFFFLPKSLLMNSVGFLDVSESYNNKASSYLGEEDTFGESLQNTSSFVAFHGKLLWYYFLCFFILIKSNIKNNLWWKYLLITAALVNITFSVPIIFFRYSLALKLVFLIVLLKDSFFVSYKKEVYLYVLLCIIGALIEVNQIRYNLIESLFKRENIIIYGILQQETNEKTFIDI